MFAAYVIALLCWLSVGHSAPLPCEQLVHPLDQLVTHLLEGRWALVAASLSDPVHAEALKQRHSASATFTTYSNTSKMFFTRTFGLGDTCQHMKSNVTLEGSSITFESLNSTVTLLYTSCPDCAVMKGHDKESKEIQRVYLFSRRRVVEEKEIEEFRAQSECLGIASPVVLDHTKELCSEEIPPPPGDTAVPAEEKTEGQ